MNTRMLCVVASLLAFPFVPATAALTEEQKSFLGPDTINGYVNAEFRDVPLAAVLDPKDLWTSDCDTTIRVKKGTSNVHIVWSKLSPPERVEYSKPASDRRDPAIWSDEVRLVGGVGEWPDAALPGPLIRIIAPTAAEASAIGAQLITLYQPELQEYASPDKTYRFSDPIEHGGSYYVHVRFQRQLSLSRPFLEKAHVLGFTTLTSMTCNMPVLYVARYFSRQTPVRIWERTAQNPYHGYPDFLLSAAARLQIQKKLPLPLVGRNAAERDLPVLRP